MVTRIFVLATALAPFYWVNAATAVDPTGHWEGAIHAPSGDVEIAIDLARDGGKLIGTFSNPAQQMTGYPLSRATANGSAITLELKIGGPDVQKFEGRLSDDGVELTGDFLLSVYSVPFSLVRAGEPKIGAAPRSPAIDESLSGAWSGSLAVGRETLRVDLTLTNHSDGTAMGSWASNGGTPTPLTIRQRGTTVELKSVVTPAAYSATLNADGSEMSGTFKEGLIVQPLTLKRATR